MRKQANRQRLLCLKIVRQRLGERKHSGLYSVAGTPVTRHYLMFYMKEFARQNPHSRNNLKIRVEP